MLIDRADYGVAAEFQSLKLISDNKDKFENKIVSLSFPVAETKVHFLLSINSPCASLKEKINEKIKELSANGQIQKITDDYLKDIR